MSRISIKLRNASALLRTPAKPGLAIVASLFLAFASTASADRIATPVPVEHTFAQAPQMDVQVAVDRASVRAALAQARATNLARFRAYQQTGVFPSNTFQAQKLNVWRDRGGHLCAAATLIDASGAHDLVRRVAEQTNFIRLGDVTQGPLMDWILTSGFTQDEIASIQEPFMPVSKPNLPVEPQLRVTENNRLRAKYAAVTKMLVDNEQKSLDAAAERLMKHGALAAGMLGG